MMNTTNDTNNSTNNDTNTEFGSVQRYDIVRYDGSVCELARVMLIENEPYGVKNYSVAWLENMTGSWTGSVKDITVVARDGMTHEQHLAAINEMDDCLVAEKEEAFHKFSATMFSFPADVVLAQSQLLAKRSQR